jgi:hypothetical protein
LKADGTVDANTYALCFANIYRCSAAPTATADTNSDQIAATAFVTTAISGATIPDALSVKGKMQLAGDLTADSPTIATDAVQKYKRWRNS